MSANKAGYIATLVACGWAGAVLAKIQDSRLNTSMSESGSNDMRFFEEINECTEHKSNVEKSKS